MRYDFTLEHLPAGYAARAARAGEGAASIITRQFVSSEDGDLLVSRLEGFPNDLVTKTSLPYGAIGTIATLIGVVRRDRTTTLWVNEPNPEIFVRYKRAVNAGDPVMLDSILDVARYRLVDIDVPADAGIVVLFSVGWRKGLFFDLTPLADPTSVRQYDLEAQLGASFGYLLRQHLFKISAVAWDNLFRSGWFPFAYLPDPVVREVISHANEGWAIDDLLDKIAAVARQEIATALPSLKNHPLIGHDFGPLERGIERFLADDFISAISILLPRIEGLLRAFHAIASPGGRAGQKALAATVEHSATPMSTLLPPRFREYLTRVFFADFDSATGGVSRNTVAHGVAPGAALDRKHAVLAVLILLQLSVLQQPPDKAEALETVVMSS